MTGSPVRGAALRLGALALLMASPSGALAQDDVAFVAAPCFATHASLENACSELALAAQAAQGLIGLSATGGVEMPGSPSTLGRRPGASPPFAGSLRLGLAHASMPATLYQRTGPADSQGALAWTIQATGVLGLTNGFSTAPTVGGMLSVDLLATLSAMSLPGARGFDDSPIGWGVGVRVGVLRESFTLPGVTLSLVHRRMGETTLGDAPTLGGEATLGVHATSVRATVGKDFVGFNILGGLGWERYTSDVDLTSTDLQSLGEETGFSTNRSLVNDRVMFYGGLGYTFLVVQLSAEAGFVQGFPSMGDRTEVYDPTSGSVFLRVAARVTRVTF